MGFNLLSAIGGAASQKTKEWDAEREARLKEEQLLKQADLQLRNSMRVAEFEAGIKRRDRSEESEKNLAFSLSLLNGKYGKVEEIPTTPTPKSNSVVEGIEPIPEGTPLFKQPSYSKAFIPLVGMPSPEEQQSWIDPVTKTLNTAQEIAWNNKRTTRNLQIKEINEKNEEALMRMEGIKLPVEQKIKLLSMSNGGLTKLGEDTIFTHSLASEFTNPVYMQGVIKGMISNDTSNSEIADRVRENFETRLVNWNSYSQENLKDALGDQGNPIYASGNRVKVQDAIDKDVSMSVKYKDDVTIMQRAVDGVMVDTRPGSEAQVATQVVKEFGVDFTKGLVASHKGKNYLEEEQAWEDARPTVNKLKDIVQRQADKGKLVDTIWSDANLAKQALEEFDAKTQGKTLSESQVEERNQLRSEAVYQTGVRQDLTRLGVQSAASEEGWDAWKRLMTKVGASPDDLDVAKKAIIDQALRIEDPNEVRDYIQKYSRNLPLANDILGILRGTAEGSSEVKVREGLESNLKEQYPLTTPTTDPEVITDGEPGAKPSEVISKTEEGPKPGLLIVRDWLKDFGEKSIKKEGPKSGLEILAEAFIDGDPMVAEQAIENSTGLDLQTLTEKLREEGELSPVEEKELRAIFTDGLPKKTRYQEWRAARIKKYGEPTEGK